MTKIKFFKKGDKFVGIECSGHTEYADFGKDIICASISSIVQSCYLGLSKVLKINMNLNKSDSGYIKFELPKNIDNVDMDKSQVLFETLYVSIKDLCEGYSKYISMEVIEYVY